MGSAHILFLKLGSRPLFLEQGGNIGYVRINSNGRKAGQFVQIMGFINLKKGFT